MLRAGGLAVLFLSAGVAVGMGFFHSPSAAPHPVPTANGDAAAGFASALDGALITERRPAGQEWQSMVLIGRYNNDLDGTVHMSLYEEPANVLRARFEAEARRDGWKTLSPGSESDERLELYHDDGRVQIIAIDESSNGLRSVTVFTGRLARR